MFLLAMSGKMGSGKDTAADVLVEKYGFKKLSFADPLKEICAAAFELDLEHMYGLKDKPLPKIITVTPLMANNLCDDIIEKGCKITSATRDLVIEDITDKSFNTPRALLQYVGTDVGRNIISKTIWIDINRHLVSKMDGNIVIPDCRFEDEVVAIKDMGGYTAMVIRPSTVISHNAAIHESENSLNKVDFDITILNDTTVGALREQVEMWYKLKRAL